MAGPGYDVSIATIVKPSPLQLQERRLPVTVQVNYLPLPTDRNYSNFLSKNQNADIVDFSLHHAKGSFNAGAGKNILNLGDTDTSTFTLNAEGGDDTVNLDGGWHNNFILNGGAGKDTLVLGGSINDWTTVNAATNTFKHKWTGNVVTLNGFEQVTFVNGLKKTTYNI